MSISMSTNPAMFSRRQYRYEIRSEAGSAKYVDLKVSECLSDKSSDYPKRSSTEVVQGEIKQLLAAYLYATKRQGAAGAKVGVRGRHAEKLAHGCQVRS